MDWKTLKERFASPRTSAPAPFRLPSVIVEIQPDFILAAKLDRSARRVRHIAVGGVDRGSLKPDVARPNVVQADSLRKTLDAGHSALRNGTGQIGLLLPDGAVRVAVLPFETIPESGKEVEALVRWKMEQSLGCAPEELRFSYQVPPRGGTGFEILALAMKNSVLDEYRAMLAELGDFDLVLPVTTALLPLLGSESGAQLLLNVCSGWITSVVVYAERVAFWRTREILHGSPEEARRAVITEAGRVLASTHDHMGVDITHTWLCARPRVSAEFAEQVSRAIGQEVKMLALDPGLGAALEKQERSAFEDFGASVAGLLVNR